VLPLAPAPSRPQPVPQPISARPTARVRVAA
jgi:hypothetical protein